MEPLPRMDNVTVRSKGARHPRASLQLSRRPTLEEAFEAVKRGVRHRVSFSDEMAQTGEAMERALTYMKVGMPTPAQSHFPSSGQPADATCYERARDWALALFSHPCVQRGFLVIALVTAFLIVAFGLLIAWVCLGLFAGVDNGWTAMDADCLELAARYALIASDCLVLPSIA